MAIDNIKSDTENIATKRKMFNELMGKLSLIKPDVKTSRDKANLLEVSENTFASWKSRGNIPYADLVSMCLKLGVSLEWLFRNDGKMNYTQSIANSLVNESSEAYDVSDPQHIIDVVTVVTPIMEACGVTRNKINYQTMIKTFNKYKKNSSADINIILEAVAQTIIETQTTV